MNPTTPKSPTRLFWCSDCQRYVSKHPLDHLDEDHPPQFADGSRALPERIAA